MRRLALVFFACTPNQEPAGISVAPSVSGPATASAIATTTATASAIATATASATEPASTSASAPAFDLAKCGTTPWCKWSVGYQSACSGAAVRPGANLPTPTPVCVCNGCLSDADCTAKAGGKCETFPLMCRPSARACTYPGDLCEKGGQACEKLMGTGSGPPMHKACYNDGKGHASCGPFQWPPP